jgi:hypothetical protein
MFVWARSKVLHDESAVEGIQLLISILDQDPGKSIVIKPNAWQSSSLTVIRDQATWRQ